MRILNNMLSVAVQIPKRKIVGILFFMVLTNSAYAQLTNTPWPMFHHDLQRTGRSPYYGPDQPDLNWVFPTVGAGLSSPAIAKDGTIYIGSGDHKFYAIYPDGTPKWTFTTNDWVNSSAAIASDGTIYFSSYWDKLYALKPNGTLKWSIPLYIGISSPAIGTDGTIYLGSLAHELYAVDPDGTRKWTFPTNGSIDSSPAIGSDGTIYVGVNFDKILYAINPEGTLKWSSNATDYIVFSTPAIASDGTIYIGSWDFYLYAFNPNGTEKWAFRTGNPIISSPAIGWDGTIYISSYDERLYAINPDGTEKWSFSLEGPGNDASPVVGGDGTIYVGSRDKKLYAINTDGVLKWAFETGDEVLLSTPAIGVDGSVYIVSHDQKLYALRDKTKRFCKILVTGQDRSDNASLLAAAGHQVTYERNVAVFDTMDLSVFDQVWYSDYINLPGASGLIKLSSFAKSGGRVFFVGDGYESGNQKAEALANWRDSMCNDLGAGGIKQNPSPLRYPEGTLFNTNPAHPISHKPFEVRNVGHRSEMNGFFESIGNGTMIVEDQRISEPVAIAFDYGDLTGAPGARVVIYLNSNNSTNWQEYAANIAHFLGSRQQPMILSVEDAMGAPGGKGKAKIHLENFQDVAGVQFTLTDIPDLLTVDTVYVSARASEFMAGFNEDASGALGIVLFNTSGAGISPGNGPVAKIVYTVSSSAVIGDSADLQLSDTILSGLAGQALPVTTADGVFRFGLLRGDVNGDGVVDVIDLIRTVNIILELPPEPTESELQAADCNADGEVNILDVVCIMNIILGREPGGTMLAKAEGTNTLEIPVTTLVPGEKSDIPVLANLSEEIAGVQLSIKYDSENLSISQPVLAARASEMSLTSQNKNGALTVILYSFDGKLIQPGEGAIITIPVETKTGGQGIAGPSLAHAILAGADAQPVAIDIITAVDETSSTLPTEFALHQNYPNPFNPETQIRFQMPEAGHVSLRIYNLLGEEIATLIDRREKAGYHSTVWGARDTYKRHVASGIYFYRLEVLADSGERFVATRKMSLLR